MKTRTLSAVSAFLMAGSLILAIVAHPRVFPIQLSADQGSLAAAWVLAAVFLGLGFLALRGSRAAFLTLFFVYAAAALYTAYRAGRAAMESRGDSAVLGGSFIAMALGVVVISAFFAAVNWMAGKKKPGQP